VAADAWPLRAFLVCCCFGGQVAAAAILMHIALSRREVSACLMLVIVGAFEALVSARWARWAVRRRRQPFNLWRRAGETFTRLLVLRCGQMLLAAGLICALLYWLLGGVPVP
jgi:hypothetical protein